MYAGSISIPKHVLPVCSHAIRVNLNLGMDLKCGHFCVNLSLLQPSLIFQDHIPSRAMIILFNSNYETENCLYFIEYDFYSKIGSKTRTPVTFNFYKSFINLTAFCVILIDF